MSTKFPLLNTVISRITSSPALKLEDSIILLEIERGELVMSVFLRDDLYELYLDFSTGLLRQLLEKVDSLMNVDFLDICCIDQVTGAVFPPSEFGEFKGLRIKKEKSSDLL